MTSSGTAELPISAELLDILRCPLAVQEREKYGEDPGRLELVHNSWLVSADSGLKYPIRDGIPVMLIDEGMKWQSTAVDALPVPPPAAETAAPAVDGTSTAITSGSSTKKWVAIGALAFAAIVVLRRLFK